MKTTLEGSLVPLILRVRSVLKQFLRNVDDLACFAKHIVQKLMILVSSFK